MKKWEKIVLFLICFVGVWAGLTLLAGRQIKDPLPSFVGLVAGGYFVACWGELRKRRH